MKKKSIFKVLSFVVMAGMLAIAITGCKKDPADPVDNPPAGKTTITMAGTAADGVPEASKVLKESEGIYSYTGALNAGELSFKTVQSGKSGYLYITAGDSGVSTSGSTRQTAKGYYEFEIDLENSTFSMKQKVEFGSGDVYLCGGDVFMPRTGSSDPMPAMKPVAGNAFAYEYIGYLGEGSMHLYFQNDRTKSTAYKLADGTIAFFNKDGDKTADATEWPIAEAGGYKIAIDIMTRTATITPVTFFPDNVTELYVVGNAFGNGGADPTAVDAALTASGSAGAVKMTRSASDPNVFTIAQDLKADQGGIWFLFQQRHSVPAFIKDADNEDLGKFFFTTGDTEADDTDTANQWTVDEDANYTITVNISTKAVTVARTAPKVDVIPAGYDLYIAGAAAEKVPEANRKLTLGASNRFEYKSVLGAGELHFVAKKEGEADINLFVDAGSGKVGAETASGYSVVKGFHDITIEPEEGAYTAAAVKEIGDYIYMHAAHVNYPRYGLWQLPALMPVAATADNPFVFEIRNAFYNVTSYEGGASDGYSFFLANSHDNALRLVKGADDSEVLLAGGEAHWKIPATTSELRVTINLLTMKAETEAITLYPDNVQTIWMIGNTFSNAVMTAGPYNGQPVNLETAVLDPNAEFGGPSLIDRYTMGWNYWPAMPERFPMTKTGNNTYNITRELKKDEGGFWFLLRAKGSLPAIINDGTGKAMYYQGEIDLPLHYSDRGGKDALAESHWTVAEDGNYTITLNTSTGAVNIVKN